jgi:hypothetical protein
MAGGGTTTIDRTTHRRPPLHTLGELTCAVHWSRYLFPGLGATRVPAIGDIIDSQAGAPEPTDTDTPVLLRWPRSICLSRRG